MSQNLRNYTKAIYALDAVVKRMPQAAWDNQSPCDDWSAREVLGHTIWGMNRLASVAQGGPTPAEQAEAEVAGAQPWATWAEASNNILASLDQRNSLQREFEGPFGQMSVEGALGIFFADPLAHAWDVAQAGGIEAALPEDIAAIAAGNLAAAGDGVRVPGMFGPAQQAASESAVDQFIALTGRQA